MRVLVKTPAGLAQAPQLFLASRVAHLHYVEDLTNLEIAGRLGISRFRVARLLERALKSGIVEITIHSPLEVDEELSSALIAKYGLAEALVYPVRSASHADQNGELITAEVGRLAARYLADILTDGAKFGVTWGTSLEAVARALGTIGDFPRSDVVQLVGGLSSASNSSRAMDVLARFASVSGGTLSALDAPLVVSDPQTADRLRAENSIHQTLSQVADLAAAVVGIGSWDPPNSQVIPLFSESDRERAAALHAAGDIAAIIIDREGNELPGDIATRTIRARSEDFRKIPYVIGVASGAGKTNGVRAVLAGKWANVLVTDSVLARALLSDSRRR